MLSEDLQIRSLKKGTGHCARLTGSRRYSNRNFSQKIYCKKYQVNVPHYSISIIRGRGIDNNAMKYLLSRYEPGQLLFVDGWIGKGAILNELKKDLAQYEGVSSDIAVIADPANVTELCGTHDDILIPSSCLNSTVSGLISRTFLRSDIIGKMISMEPSITEN